MNTKKILLINALLASQLISCSKKENSNHDFKITNNGKEIKLKFDDEITYILPSGEKLTINAKTDGFDFLYSDSNNQISIHKSPKGLGTISSKLGLDSYDIIDTDGDFYPNYISNKSGKKVLSWSESEVKGGGSEKKKGGTP